MKQLLKCLCAAAMVLLVGCSGIPSLEETFTLDEEHINGRLQGSTQDRIRAAWGEPDSFFSGLYGDIYRDPRDENRLIGIYYDQDSQTVTRVILFAKQTAGH